MLKSVQAETVPYNVDAERAVLGGILLDNRKIEEAAETLRPDDFFLDQNRRIFSVVLLMERDRKPIDLVTLVDELRIQGELAAVGGDAYVAQILDGMPNAINVRQYARIVKEDSTRRGLIALSGRVAMQASGREKVDGIVEELERGIGEIRDGELNRAAITIGEAVEIVRPMLRRVAETKGVVLGTPTGYRYLDTALAGWIPGQLVILAARPSVGKTALAMEFLYRQALQGNAGVIFSLETSKETIALRLACLVAKIDCHTLRRGYLGNDGWANLEKALDKLARMPIWIDDCASMHAHNFRYRLRSLAQRRNIKLAVIDYLQLLRARAESRTQEVTEVSRTLKESAKEIGEISGGTLLALSQLRRIEDRTQPRLEDLRESGQIEQDADVVLFVYNAKDQELSPGQKEPYRKVVEVAKQKEGPLDFMEMVFWPPWMGFELAASGGSGEEWLDA